MFSLICPVPVPSIHSDSRAHVCVLAATVLRPERVPRKVKRKTGLDTGGWRRATVPLALHRPTRLPVREGRLQSLEATLRPTLITYSTVPVLYRYCWF